MFYVCSKKDGKYGVKDTNDGVIVYCTKAEIKKVCDCEKVKIVGVRQDLGKQTMSVVPIQFNYSSVGYLVWHLQRYLKDKGIRNVGMEERLYDNSNKVGFSVRFLGGFDAWSGDEDICDADVLDRKVGNLVRQACKEFEKETGVLVDFCTGEKARTYFEFS